MTDALPKYKNEIGSYAVDGYDMASVIRLVSYAGSAGTWETVCTCKGENWKENARLIASLLEANRKAGGQAV